MIGARLLLYNPNLTTLMIASPCLSLSNWSLASCLVMKAI